MARDFVKVSGGKALQARLKLASRKTEAETKQTLGDIGEDLLGKSLDLVLYKTGDLYDSAYIRIEDGRHGPVLEVGYRAEHAAAAHELPEDINPTTPGTAPKFLERPLMENKATYKDMLLDAGRRPIRGR